jgi:hypothetical protein
MDQVLGLQLTSLRASLNAGHWLPDQRLRLNLSEPLFLRSNLHHRSRSGRLGANPARGGTLVSGATGPRFRLTRDGRI